MKNYPSKILQLKTPKHWKLESSLWQQLSDRSKETIDTSSDKLKQCISIKSSGRANFAGIFFLHLRVQIYLPLLIFVSCFITVFPHHTSNCQLVHITLNLRLEKVTILRKQMSGVGVLWGSWTSLSKSQKTVKELN